MTGQSRESPVTYEAADAVQRQLWDAIVDSRGQPGGPESQLIGEDGALIGPFNHMVASPKLGKRLSALGAAVRFESAVDNRLLELAICTVGAHWRSNFEFWAHGPMAIEAGVAPSVIEALGQNRTPDFVHEDEATVFAFAHQLVSTGRVDDHHYQAAGQLLGPDGLADLITTIGYYSLISLTLNAHEVQVPDGHGPTWPT